MKSVFLDSNIWLRLFLKDQESQYGLTSSIIRLINEGELRPYTSTIIFLEVNYVLKSFYGLSNEKTLHYLLKIKEVKNITVIEKENLDVALKFYREYKIKFADCLIASQIPDNVTLLSFDQDFKKIKNLNYLLPSEFLSTLSKN